jgi:hypothetical protein
MKFIYLFIFQHYHINFDNGYLLKEVQYAN